MVSRFTILYWYYYTNTTIGHKSPKTLSLFKNMLPLNITNIRRHAVWSVHCIRRPVFTPTLSCEILRQVRNKRAKPHETELSRKEPSIKNSRYCLCYPSLLIRILTRGKQKRNANENDQVAQIDPRISLLLPMVCRFRDGSVSIERHGWELPSSGAGIWRITMLSKGELILKLYIK